MKKKWIISAGVALALGALATVAVAERGEKMREHRQPAMRMLEHLDLTDEQQEQLQALREKHREAMREQREAMAAMGKEQREAVMNILTKEQQEAMKEMRSKRGKFFGRRGWGGKDRHDMRRGGKDHDMRRGGKGAFSRLDLTDEQKEQLVELRKGHRTEMRETRQKQRTALENVLTDEQRGKLEADEGRGVLRRQTLARQAVSTNSCFPSRRGVAGLLRVFYFFQWMLVRVRTGCPQPARTFRPPGPPTSVTPTA